jgi:hypothetical protein
VECTSGTYGYYAVMVPVRHNTALLFLLFNHRNKEQLGDSLASIMMGNRLFSKVFSILQNLMRDRVLESLI